MVTLLVWKDIRQYVLVVATFLVIINIILFVLRTILLRISNVRITVNQQQLA